MRKRFASRVLFASMTIFLTAALQAAGSGSGSVKAVSVRGADSGSVAVDSAGPSARDLARVARFYARLLAEHGYRPAIDPVASFSQGAPALTSEAAELALGEARSAAGRLTVVVAELESYRSNREGAGVQTSEDFEGRMARDLSEISSLAGKIRSDFYVRLLDRMERENVLEVLPESLSEGPTATRLRRLAEELKRGIASRVRPESVQVVSVQDLRRPSLESVSRAIQDLARALGPSPRSVEADGESTPATR